MERLEDYIAFDLEFNQHEGRIYLIQVSAVRFRDGQEIDAYDSYVHTNVPLKKFYQWFDWDYSRNLKRCSSSGGSHKRIPRFCGYFADGWIQCC